jgi:ATP-binding cassette subfamily B protein
MVLGLSCVFIGNGIGLTAPMVIRDAVNDLVLEVTEAKLARYGLTVVGIVFLQGIFLFLQRRIIVGMSRDIEYEMRNEMFEHFLKLDVGFYHEYRTGDLMSRAINDLGAVRMMIGPAIMYLANTIAVFVYAIPLMIKVSGRLTLVALATMPLVSIATKFFGQRIHDQFEKIQEHLSNLSAKAQENLSGVRIVRAYGQEEPERRAFRRLNREYVKRNMSLVKLSGLFYPTLFALIGVSGVSVLWYGGGLAMRQEINVGQFVEFTLYLARLTWPVIALGWVVNLFQRGTASLGRIHQLLVREPSIRDEAMALPRTESAVEMPVAVGSPDGNGDGRRATHGRIEFRDLTFAFDGKEPVLKNINLTIQPGETVAVVGRTGSGKTTLVSLIARLNDPPVGTLFVDGRDVRTIPLNDLRGAIGMVPQEPFLFGLTVGENIAFGVDSAADGEVEQAAVQAGLFDDIQGFSDGFQTRVGERGITLSGGQKQRTAIARAVIRQPTILILDDALSSVDTHTEERILTHLREVMKDRTAIIISHRVSTVKDADKIIVLESGRIIEQGSHDDLLEKRGVYADLYEKQLLEEELAASD